MAATTGTVSGTITWTDPPALGGTPAGDDEVLVRQPLAPGGSGTPRDFIVRTGPVTGAASPEPYSILLLPTGPTYSVFAVRHVSDGMGGEITFQTSPVDTAAPASGVTLSFP
jgi:hypothetical protein